MEGDSTCLARTAHIAGSIARAEEAAFFCDNSLFQDRPEPEIEVARNLELSDQD